MRKMIFSDEDNLIIESIFKTISSHKVIEIPKNFYIFSGKKYSYSTLLKQYKAITAANSKLSVATTINTNQSIDYNFIYIYQ